MSKQVRYALLFFFFALAGCTIVPTGKQMITGGNGSEVVRSDGTCGEVLLRKDNRQSQYISSQTISILSWNIYKGVREGWYEELLQLSGQKDVILLQEAPFGDKLQEFLEERKLYWGLNSAFKVNGQESGVLLASKVLSLEQCGFRTVEPLLRLPKMTLAAHYALGNESGTLLVINLHGINFSLGTVSYKKQFQGVAEILKGHDGPVILAGDFNDWTDRRSAIIADLADKFELNYLLAGPLGRTTIFGDPVDHILYRGLEPISFQVHHASSSDHNPIEATFRITGR